MRIARLGGRADEATAVFEFKVRLAQNASEESRIAAGAAKLFPSLSVFLEKSPSRKRELRECLTAKLPEWFGRKDANERYALLAETLEGYVAESRGVRCGLLLLKHISAVSAEIHWLGVDPGRHRSGVGRALVDSIAEDCRRRNVRYLFVATLHPSVLYEPFQRTRRFYEATGFAYVLEEHFVTDPGNPMAYYLKHL
jgi:GNAT superfamily N-acetyltransferase